MLLCRPGRGGKVEDWEPEPFFRPLPAPEEGPHRARDALRARARVRRRHGRSWDTMVFGEFFVKHIGSILAHFTAQVGVISAF